MLAVPAFCRSEQSASGSEGKLKIILAYPLVRQWAEKAAKAPAEDRLAMFKQMALSPILDDCFPGQSADQAMTSLQGTVGNPADWDLAAVQSEISVLERNRRKISRLIRSAYRASQTRLPTTEPVTFCVFYLSSYWGPVREQFNGIFGFTPSGNSIRVFIAPVGEWLHWLPDTVAHEYHHAAWMQLLPGASLTKSDLLGVLVSEGRADQFAGLVTGLAGPWTAALSTQQECDVFKKLSPRLHDAHPNWYVLNNARAGQFPQWAGYTIGYRMVGDYLRGHPQASIKDWTLLPASTLFDAAGYKGGCQNAP